MNQYELLLVFCIAFFAFQMTSKITIEWFENARNTGSPLYGLSLTGVLLSIYAGAYSLYQLSNIVRKQNEYVEGKDSESGS